MRPSSRWVLLLLFYTAFSDACTWSSPAAASGWQRAADINQSPTGRSVREAAIEFGGSVLLVGYSDDHGEEVWISDGTALGTTLLKDVNPGPYPSRPARFVEFAGSVYFWAYTLEHGRELWKTDGTEQGTELVADLMPGQASSDEEFEQPVVSGGKLYFTCVVPTGIELCAMNSSETITQLDPNDVTYPQDLTAVGTGLLFTATTTNEGREPWFTQGTDATTNLLVDLKPGSESSNPDWFLPTSNSTVLAAARQNTRPELVLLQPNGNATWLGPEYPSRAALIGQDAYFGDGELYVLEFGSTTPTLVAEIVPGILGSNPSSLTVAGGKLFFLADDGITGDELWVHDPVLDTTTPVADLWPGEDDPSIQHLLAWNDTLYFTACSTVTTCSIFFTTGAGVTSFEGYSADERPSLFATTSHGFWGRHDEPSPEIFVAGSVVGQVTPVHEPVSTGSSPRSLTPGLEPGEVLFSALDDLGSEPWVLRADGSAERIADIQPGSGWSSVSGFMVAGGRALFTAEGPSGRQPWVWDGSVATELPLEVDPLALRGLWVRLGDRILLHGYFLSGTTAPGLYAIDPAAGTSELLTTFVDDGSVAFGDLLYQAGDVALFGKPGELWSTDGTGLGTQSLVTLGIQEAIEEGAVLSSSTEGSSFEFVFLGEDELAGREAFFSNGVQAESGLLEDLIPGEGDGFPRNFISDNNGRAIFETNDDVVYVTDGTIAGTDPLTLTLDGSNPRPVAHNGSVWLFSMSTPSTGKEFWITDGTPGGTFVLDIAPGEANSLGISSGTFAAVHLGKFYFSAWTAERGYELWESDGTVGGTQPLPELIPGPAGTFGSEAISVIGDRLYMPINGADGAGEEIWSFEIDVPLFEDGFESGDVLGWSSSTP